MKSEEPTATTQTEPRPLTGFTVAITRPELRAASLAAAFNRAGARVVFIPSIETAPPLSYAALDACIARLESYSWLVFTSVAAVEVISQRLSDQDGTLAERMPSSVRIAVVGKATASAAAQLLGRVDHIGGGNAQSLATSIPLNRGDRVLFVCSDRARDVLPLILAKRGALLDRAVGYRTVSVDAARHAELFRTNSVDVVVVYSPSSTEVLGKLAERHGVRIPSVICIGDTTAAAARSVGLRVVGVASDPSDEALVIATIHAATNRQLDGRVEAT